MNMGLSIFSIFLLLHVKGYKDRDWATVGELAEHLQTNHNGVVSLASRCEKLGFVYTQRVSVDKRAVEIHLTPAGNKLVIKISGLHHKELLVLKGVFKVPGARELA